MLDFRLRDVGFPTKVRWHGMQAIEGRFYESISFSGVCQNTAPTPNYHLAGM